MNERKNDFKQVEKHRQCIQKKCNNEKYIVHSRK